MTTVAIKRAFDIIYVLDTPRRTEVLSILTTNNLLGEGAVMSGAVPPTRPFSSSSASAS